MENTLSQLIEWKYEDSFLQILCVKIDDFNDKREKADEGQVEWKKTQAEKLNETIMLKSFNEGMHSFLQLSFPSIHNSC